MVKPFSIRDNLDDVTLEEVKAKLNQLFGKCCGITQCRGMLHGSYCIITESWVAWCMSYFAFLWSAMSKHGEMTLMTIVPRAIMSHQQSLLILSAR
jgi:hypothetical protein